MSLFDNVGRGAWVDGEHRYHLWRSWLAGARSVAWIMLNPSTADANEDDPTIRRCVGFARAWGYGSIDVVNLYSYRATSPKDLKAAGYPNGPHADQKIRDLLSRDLTRGGYADLVVCAWGSNAQKSRAREVLQIVVESGFQPQALSVTASGHPGHPLYLRGDCRPSPFTMP